MADSSSFTYSWVTEILFFMFSLLGAGAGCRAAQTATRASQAADSWSAIWSQDFWDEPAGHVCRQRQKQQDKSSCRSAHTPEDLQIYTSQFLYRRHSCLLFISYKMRKGKISMCLTLADFLHPHILIMLSKGVHPQRKPKCYLTPATDLKSTTLTFAAAIYPMTPLSSQSTSNC